MKSPLSLLWILTLTGLLAFWMPAVEGQAFVDTYGFLDGAYGDPHGAYDSSRDRWLVASVRPYNPFTQDMALDVTVKDPAQAARTYSFIASFLDAKHAHFEIVEVISDGEGYAIFLNKLIEKTGHWSSWVVHLDADLLVVDWARRIQSNVDPDAYLRVRDAVGLRGGYAVVVGFNDPFPDPPAPASSAVLRLDDSGSVLWSRAYELPREVALVAVSYGLDGLVVGGWISEILADDIQGLVLLKVELHTGALLTAAQYEGVVVLDDLAMAQSVGSANTTGGLYVAGRSDGNDVTFLPVDSSLLAGTATRMATGSNYRPVEFAFTAAGDLVAAMQSYFPGDLVLTVPAPLTGGTGTPILSDLSPMFPADGVEISTADRVGNEVLLTGYQEEHVSAPTDPVNVISTDGSGLLDSCVPAYGVPTRESVPMVTHYFAELSDKPRAINLVSVPVNFIDLNTIYPVPLCF